SNVEKTHRSTFAKSPRFRSTVRGRSQISRPSDIQPFNQRRVSFAESATDIYDPIPRSIEGRNSSVLRGNSSESAFNFQRSQNEGFLQEGRNAEALNFREEKQF
ncbi:hypothetical protein TNCV_560131, partial [Trichonephila clavipes]